MKKQTGSYGVRVKEPCTLAEARKRLDAYKAKHGSGPHKAAWLAGAIWPNDTFRSNQGAGAAASRVLKRVGCHWTSSRTSWGWVI